MNGQLCTSFNTSPISTRRAGLVDVQSPNYHASAFVHRLLGRRCNRCVGQRLPALQRARQGGIQATAGQDAPILADAPAVKQGRLPNTGPPKRPSTGPSKPPSNMKILYKRVLRRLSNLKLAIAELSVIAALCAVGTVIDQNLPLDFYQQFYPSDGRLLDWRLITLLEWDHVYTSTVFLALNALLAASLTACTFTRQWPAVKVARRWRFIDLAALSQLDKAQTLPGARLGDLALVLAGKGYQVFRQEGQLYAFKGLAGKLGPIGVHASLLAIIGGVTIGAFGTFKGELFIPEGGQALIASALQPASPLARLPEGGKAVIQVDDFQIAYRPDGSIQQFYTDLKVFDLRSGEEVLKKTISVNSPLRYRGITGYQTDWAMAAMDIRVQGLPAAPPLTGPNTAVGPLQSDAKQDNRLRLPMAEVQQKLKTNGSTWATFLPLDAGEGPQGVPKGITLLAQDFQSVVIYDTKGNFVGVRRPGSGKSINVEGVSLIVDNIVGSSGIQFKVDPGVPYVYAGFGGLMLTTVVSAISHSQVWAVQDASKVHVGGKSNRDKVMWGKEYDDMLEAVPEVVVDEMVKST